jgi:archaellum biogenesis ATPase FlaH
VFLDKFTNTYNSCFPLKKIKISKHKSRKPWVSKGLLKSIKRKNKLYRKYMNQPCNSNENIYKTFKNKLNHLLQIAKLMYYEKQLEHVRTNTKNTWKILKEVINTKKAMRKVTNRLYC